MDELERYGGAILSLATSNALEFTGPACEPIDDILAATCAGSETAI